MRPQVDPRHRQAGFTLVEALVSLALVGMAGVLVVAGLGGTHQVWTRSGTLSRNVETVEAAQALLRQRLESAVPATRYDGGPHADLDGQPTTLSFVAPPGDAFGPGGPRKYVLRLTASGDLMLSSVGDGLPTPLAVRREEILLAGAQSLDLAYFGAAQPDSGRTWQRVWQKHSVPPQLIRIRVHFPPGDSRWWPELVVRPRADLDTDCLLDSDGSRCRAR
ncbi:MAG: prepilin-type N-terminal cleavage/methylation domain-containing protein [Bacteroidota bacterium]